MEKFHSFIFRILKMMIALLKIFDKEKKLQFFYKIFLITNFYINFFLEILFYIFNNFKVNFIELML